MIKRYDKKAQQSNWFMIILVIAVITLVVVALAVTGAFGKISEIFNKVKDLEVAAQACGQYAAANLETSYCNTFEKVDINGEAQYANCPYLKEHGAVFDDKGMKCNEVETNNLIKEFCKNKKSEIIINGKKCTKNSNGNWIVQ